MLLDAAHEVRNGQIEALGEDIKRVQTRLFGSMFKSVKKCSVQAGML